MAKQKQKQPTIEELRKEQRELLVSRENPKRLAELTDKLNYFDWGIK